MMRGGKLGTHSGLDMDIVNGDAKTKGGIGGRFGPISGKSV